MALAAVDLATKASQAPHSCLTALCCAGADESYEESAEREIEEEMGVKNVQLQNCFDFYHADDISRVWGRLFSCTYDGTFKLDPEEVESGDFMSVKVSLHGSMHEGQLLFPSNYTIHFCRCPQL